MLLSSLMKYSTNIKILSPHLNPPPDPIILHPVSMVDFPVPSFLFLTPLFSIINFLLGLSPCFCKITVIIFFTQVPLSSASAYQFSNAVFSAILINWLSTVIFLLIDWYRFCLFLDFLTTIKILFWVVRSIFLLILLFRNFYSPIILCIYLFASTTTPLPSFVYLYYKYFILVRYFLNKVGLFRILIYLFGHFVTILECLHHLLSHLITQFLRVTILYVQLMMPFHSLVLYYFH